MHVDEQQTAEGTGIELRGAAVAWGDRIVLIVGGPGSGTSTLAGELCRGGGILYSDGLVAVDGRGRVLPFPAGRSSSGDERGPMPVALVLVTGYEPADTWVPRITTGASSALAILGHVLGADLHPERALSLARRLADDALTVSSTRGEARDALEDIADLLATIAGDPTLRFRTAEPATAPEPLAPDRDRDWISFADPENPERVWMFDTTFLLSRWTCIYGDGCQGLHEGRADEGCCSEAGAGLVTPGELARVRAAASRLTPEQWQHHRLARLVGPFSGEGTGDPCTRSVEDACIFLNHDGFAGGTGCALHIGATEAGESPSRWKPRVCSEVPLRIIRAREVTGRELFVLREWDLGSWGERSTGFDWWCTSAPEAHVGVDPVYVDRRETIVELAGTAVYDELARRLEGRALTPPPTGVAVAAPTRRPTPA